jgi:capsular exopolysaccharide synthesis family protein
LIRGEQAKKDSEMARDMIVRNGGWRVKDVRGQEVGPHLLPTMAEPGEIDLRRFFRTLWRGKWILLLTMVATMAATFYWLLQVTPLYTADVLIVVEARPSSIVKVEEAVQDVTSDAAKVNTEVAILESRGLAARVIRHLGLEDDPEFLGDDAEVTAELSSDGDLAGGSSPGREVGAASPHGSTRDADPDLMTKLSPRAVWSTVSAALESARSFLTSAWAGDANSNERGVPEPLGDDEEAALLLDEAGERQAVALLNRFLKRLSVKFEDQSRLISISFTSIDAKKAAFIANRIVQEYMQSQLEAKSEGARRAAEWLEVRLAELGETVKSLERTVQRQRAESGSDAVDIVSQRLAELTSQLVSAQAAVAAAGAHYKQVRAVLDGHGNLDALPAVIGSTGVQELRAKHSDLTARLSELQTVYGEKHPQIVSMRAEIAGIERRLAVEISNVLAGLRNELESAEMNEAALRQELATVRHEMFQLDQAEATIGQVAQRLQANQDLYQNLLKRYTEAVALRENQQPDARIISPAQTPLRPSHPDFPRILALSFVGSAGLAVFVLVIAERLRQKLNTVEDVERHVGLQVIGVIPDLPRVRRLASSPRDYIQREPLSEFGGAFQRLRALLTLSNNRVMPRTVLVTSCAAGEGKTTIAVCLSIASISSGQRVLLVDCDFARPQVHRMLDVKNDKGLTDILKGTAILEAAITQPAGTGLSILTVGRSPDGAIDLLNSARMEALLDQLQEIFDIIILDSAPVQVSNALILGGLADKTIFVTRRDWTTHRQASYAVKQLQLYGADIAGVVFNRAGAVMDYAA